MESRRNFLKKSLLSGSLATTFLSSLWAQGGEEAKTARTRKGVSIDDEKLKEVYAQTVLKKELFPEPVIIESLDLIMIEDEFLVRARSEDGAEKKNSGYALKILWGFAKKR